MVASSTTNDKEIGQIPSALRVAGPTALLLCCSSSPMPYIDSSSRLESEPFCPQQMACYSWDRTLGWDEKSTVRSIQLLTTGLPLATIDTEFHSQLRSKINRMSRIGILEGQNPESKIEVHWLVEFGAEL